VKSINYFTYESCHYTYMATISIIYFRRSHCFYLCVRHRWFYSKKKHTDPHSFTCLHVCVCAYAYVRKSTNTVTRFVSRLHLYYT